MLTEVTTMISKLHYGHNSKTTYREWIWHYLFIQYNTYNTYNIQYKSIVRTCISRRVKIIASKRSFFLAVLPKLEIPLRDHDLLNDLLSIILFHSSLKTCAFNSPQFILGQEILPYNVFTCPESHSLIPKGSIVSSQHTTCQNVMPMISEERFLFFWPQWQELWFAWLIVKPR